MKDEAGSTSQSPCGLFRGARAFGAALAGAVMLAGAPGPPAQDEFVLKAQALVELCPYFTWPGPRDVQQTFTLAVVGRSPFGPHLDAYVRRRTVLRRRIEVRYLQRLEELSPCDLVFICRSERKRANDILGWARGRGVLTVTDDDDLLRQGVMVAMVVEGGLLRLYVNPQIASSERFVVSSQLLRVARIIESR